MWVFAYGSLMWRPDFPFVEVRPARLAGYHRSLCIRSTHYRGTPARPGLVLGLDRGGSCLGRAFRVAPAEAEAVLRTLHEREMITNVYLPRFLPVLLDDGRRVPAWAFVVDRGHAQYWRGDQPAAALMVRTGVGSAGSSRDYVADTVRHLDQLGIRDSALHRLLRVIDADGPA
jgi:cation transport protein ChaC